MIGCKGELIYMSDAPGHENIVHNRRSKIIPEFNIEVLDAGIMAVMKIWDFNCAPPLSRKKQLLAISRRRDSFLEVG